MYQRSAEIRESNSTCYASAGPILAQVSLHWAWMKCSLHGTKWPASDVLFLACVELETQQ